MFDHRPSAGSLALYKIRPAIVTAVSDKIDITLDGCKSKRVRPKDIAILHPGPLKSLGDLGDPAGNVDEAWALLEGGETHLEELAELAFGDYTPTTAWAAWQLVAEGLYFEGTPENIKVRSEAQIAEDRAQCEAKAAAERDRETFLERLRSRALEEGDRERLSEVERMALKVNDRSRILQALGHQESAENAHRMLVDVGYWEATHNPYPARQSLVEVDPDHSLPELPREERLDLTHLAAYAIDDEGSQDPDDAISLDGDRIWVHVADVAALVTPDSELDLEARERAANLYIPERIVHMLPPAITDILGLGLQEISPALSFGFRLDEQGEPQELEVAASLVRVSRHSYAEINERMGEEPFATLYQLAERYRNRRKVAGAASIDLPEVSVRVNDENIRIKPLKRLDSRQMVTDAMLMAGEAVARYAIVRDIPVPFATQPPPDARAEPEGMAQMYAYRRQMKPSQSKAVEEAHSGLGLEVYTRTTSPLRRYLDLVTHQQLRAHLKGETLLAVSDITERIGATDGTGGAIRRAERFSNTHWKMVYLQRNSLWQGTGVVVEMNDKRATVIIPELAMETRVRLRREVPLDQEIRLAVREVDLADLTAWFRVIE
ncbi:RNB domain-containing ribonuclease [Solemya velesiana gill symbiont]|uniref:Exoribonuclease II n=1 Tax=Solemya velesiana gill symbiont TaxID=1918948 RepID=A0A1T2KW84_9GAMM|nr:RNB domain-containing ribonuclease [Solemya velesiana gill symbiont]OOZ37095.1 exoribonuclease II [Solemya velesiana gill symbiont]